ncbi:N-acetyltransferase [Jidongwangia harbinensis]|uniref:N-acetyltransferase n=1 Tax=Jidongwangia harbinensis TaxID=2878561 RepID=UPI001CD9BFB7|nr:N-acetyltransferase [Jidongwangia harbinensis]MCA2215261.1 N-acetyltransferase [Jidongwangia harbinensis]
MDLDIASVAEQPGREELWAQLDNCWPRFMMQDPTSGLYYGYVKTAYPEYALLAVDRDTGRAVAKAMSVPLAFDGDIAAGLPEGGWDWAIRTSAHDRLRGAEPTIVSALEILIRPDLRGSGLSGVMLTAMRDNVAKLGFRDLVAPVRPSGRSGHAHTPIDGYAHATRPDGLPVDPWLRVHVRAGARIVNVAHSSMVIPGTLAQWREWTGLPFDTSGPVEVPEALVPVHCDATQDQAVYVEPNVWVHHRI